MDLELRHLQLLCAIADAGSLTKAAAKLGVAATALTTQLQRIERSLGGRLFERDRYGARATPLGDVVLARARVVLPAVKGLTDEVARITDGNGRVDSYRVGTNGGPFLGGIVRRIGLAHPQARITTFAAWSAAEVAERVLSGRLDFGVVGVCGDASPSVWHRLPWREVAVAPMFVLVPGDHRLAGSSEIELAELSGEDWATTPGDRCFTDCFAAACARAGFTPRRMYETDAAGCADLARTGAAVALCQATWPTVAGVMAVPISGAPLRWRHLLGWDSWGPAAGYAAEIFDHALAAYADAVTHSPVYAKWLIENPEFAVPGRR